MKSRFFNIKKHFEKEAKLFDNFFHKIVPYYAQMQEILAQAIPFDEKKKIKVIDLGCGTGNLSLKVKHRYPNCSLTCIDMTENMIEMAKIKLKKFPDTIFRHGDIRKFDYSKRYDAVVSSMVLHHIESSEKVSFYRKLKKTLNKNGVFLNIDVFVTKDWRMQKFYIDKWTQFMTENGLSLNKIKEMLNRHKKEDRPSVIEKEVEYLHKAGFKSVNIILKNFNFAVYCAKK